MTYLATELASFNARLAIDNHIKSLGYSRLNAGLRVTMQDEVEQPATRHSYARPDHFGALLENWDTERFNPASCTLRSAVLVQSGVPTGAKSLAQETVPAAL